VEKLQQALSFAARKPTTPEVDELKGGDAILGYVLR